MRGGAIIANASEEKLMAAPEVVPASAWFRQASMGEVYLGDVQLLENEDPYLVLATPTPSGQIVAARVNMGILREVVSSVRFGNTGIVFIIDRDSYVIAHTMREVRWRELQLGVSPDHIEDASAPMYAMSDERKGITHWHSSYPNFDGVMVHGLIMALPGTDWYVVAEVDSSEALAVSRRALGVLGGSMTVFAVLVLLFTVRLLDQRLFAPIALLRQGAQRIGAGRLDHRIAMMGDGSGNDLGNNEIGQLATAFNEMATHLHNRQRQLEAQTAALNEEVAQRRQAQEELQRTRDALEATVIERTQELRATNQQLQEKLAQHQQAQEELAVVEARLRHLLLTTPAIIFSVKREGELRITYISNNIEEATGYSPEQYYADANFGVKKIHPDDLPKVISQLERLTKVDRVSYEYRFRISNGEYKWFYDDAVAVYDDHGNIREIVGSIIDIDKRKRVEEEQAAIRDQALEASRLKSEFLATVSHEIRTPLNGVVGMADMLQATPLNEDQAEYVRTIAYSADSLLVVINDILDLSKVEAGKLTLLEGDFSPRQVAQRVIDLLLPRAREKGILLSAHLAPDLPQRVHGYETRLRQVLLNLVGNAVKFTEEGSVTLSVALESDLDQALVSSEAEPRAQEADYWVRFTVTDTGIGLDEANYSKLFKPFSQVDSSLSRRYGGAGLGLAISKRLVELMGGQIHVESKPGEGSKFWITIPLHSTEEIVEANDREDGRGDAFAAGEQIIENAGEAPKRLPKYLSGFGINNSSDVTPQEEVGAHLPQVLLVEDNLVNQKVAVAQLKRFGYAVHAVGNGREAVEAVERQEYGVILMDCQMPEMDGFKATQLIRAREVSKGRQVPIVAMTANAMNGDREACIEAGMNDYIAKPIRAEELRVVVARWLQNGDRV
jgi:PAS domain S-box-containing protein